MENTSGKCLDVTEQQVDRWIASNKQKEPYKASLFQKHLARKPVCQWLGDWIQEPRKEARKIADHARANKCLYQVVVYNIPDRDAGGFSSGGSGSKKAYLMWIKEVAIGLGNREGIIIVEPDALGHANEFFGSKQESRLSVLREAIKILRKRCHKAHIYLDVGHPKWLPSAVAASLFLKAGGRMINGISLNVSNSQTTKDCFDYGSKITELVSACHGMVIDTSRNGAGPPPSSASGVESWANPSSNRLGHYPTLRVPKPNVFNHRLHALLWVKVPGESDGEYNGAPKAGIFWPQGAMTLIGSS